MANFNNDNNSRGQRDSGRGNRPAPQMHPATCSNCGKACQVPFRPTGSKPVFCNDCFKLEGNNQAKRSDNSGNRPNYSDRQMYDAVCDNCGNTCQVPFQPRGDKPVFCSNCFEKKQNQNRDARKPQSQPSERPQYKEQLDALNAKLDKILSLLAPAPAVPVTEITAIPEVTVVESITSEEGTTVEPEIKPVKKARKTTKKKTDEETASPTE
jgi:CxxC-x17-CxxC domain-containing protein